MLSERTETHMAGLLSMWGLSVFFGVAAAAFLIMNYLDFSTWTIAIALVVYTAASIKPLILRG